VECSSVEQGYAGKGLEGRGQGMECLTPRKPLPLSKGQGIPAVLPAGILLHKQFTPSSELRERRLPGTHIHIINKQTLLQLLQ
jgi:hypothetical protein